MLRAAGAGGTGSVSSPVGAGFLYNFDTATANADPGAGKFRFNNATPSAATQIYINKADINATDLSAFFLSIGLGLVLQFNQSSTKWQEFLVKGSTLSGNYYILTGVWREGLSSLDTTSLISVGSYLIAPYLGTLTGDLTALTFNANGTVATATIGGFTWTQAYNSAGQLATETSGSLTRTYNYDANGIFTGVSGAIELGGAIAVTQTQASGLTPAGSGAQIVVTDLGYQRFSYNGSRWRALNRMVALATTGVQYPLPNTSLVTEQAYAHANIKIPAWLVGPNDEVAIEVLTGGSTGGTAVNKTINARFDATPGSVSGTVVFTETYAANLGGCRYLVRLRNANAVGTQRSLVVSGYGSLTPSGNNQTVSVDFSADKYLSITGQQASTLGLPTLDGYATWLIHAE